MVDDEDERARIAWRALQAAAESDEQLHEVLAQLEQLPDEGERELRQWLSHLEDRGDAPAELATYLSGGHVERLVNIARAHTVYFVAHPFDRPDDIGDRPPPSYVATIAELAPQRLIRRERELADLAAFATGQPGYRWIVGGPWTGKTALTARFALNSPPGVDVIAYFLARRRGGADSGRFLRTINMQLAHLLTVDPPAGHEADVFRALWARALQETSRLGRHLLLVVDGLDEDDGPSRGLPSVAQLLPTNVGENGHVLVTSRHYPLIPWDVAADHPLRRVEQRELTPSPYAADLEQRARTDLDALLGSPDRDEVAIELLAMFAAAKGPLSVDDLSRLAWLGGSTVRRPRLSRVVEQDVARVLEPTSGDDEARFAFAHDTLRARAEQAFGADLATYAQRLHNWAAETAAAGWPSGSVPPYLLDTYPALLCATAPERLGELYGHLAYVEEAIRVIGIARVEADLHAAALADSSVLVAQLSRVLDREAHNLRAPRPIDKPGYASFQLCLEAQRSEATVLAARGRERLADLPVPQIVPRWTSARTTRALMLRLEGHTGPVLGVAIGSEVTRAVSAGDDHTLRVWDLATGQTLTVLKGHRGRVRGVAVDRAASRAVSAGDDRTLRVWDLATGKAVMVLRGHHDWLSAVAANAAGTRAISSSADGTLRVWDLDSGEPLSVRKGHRGRVLGVATNADVSRAVTANDDPTLTVVDLATGKSITLLEGHSDRVRGVAIDQAANRAVSASDDRTLRVWDLKTGTTIRVLDDHSAAVYAVAMSADGTRVVSASADRTLRVWDLTTGRTLSVLRGHTGWVRGVAINDAATLAVSASADGTLCVWDLATGRADELLESHTAPVRSVAVDILGTRAVSASADRSLRLWDLATGRVLTVLDGHADSVLGVAVDARATRAVSASADQTLRVWDLATGEMVRQLKGHSDRVLAVGIDPQATRAVSGSADGTVRVWDLATGRTQHVLHGHTGWVSAVAVDSTATRAVSAGSDWTLRVWDLRAGRTTGRLGCIHVLKGHSGWVSSVALNAAATRAVSASIDGTLRVWELATGETLNILEGHTGGVRGVAMDADATRAISCSHDHTVRVWDITNGLCLDEWQVPQVVVSVALSRQTGTAWLVFGEGSGAVSCHALHI